MKLFSYYLNSLQIPLLLAIISTALLDSEYFFNSSAFAYYGFCITILLFTITPPHLYLTKNKILTEKTPVVLFGLWCLYVLFHYFNHSATLVFTVYSIVLFFLLLKATTLFSLPNFNFRLLLIGISGIATLESLYCIAQFLGCFKSQSELFAVTGSWSNPNVTAIFLALSTPVFLFLFNGKTKQLFRMGFGALLIALLLLKCRAALIGTVLSIIIFYCLEYHFIDWIKNKKNRTAAKALLILSLIIIIPISSHLYNSKKASADGRKFIWKLSTAMTIEKPITGYGYGFFEKEYNLYQANYIKNGLATPEELTNAGPVIMPHNELLQNAVEGGGIGLLLISLFFGSLLFTLKQKRKTDENNLDLKVAATRKNSYFNLSYAAVVAFVVMSMINSTIKIIPTICLLIIYAAIICSTSEPLRLHKYFVLIQNNKAITVLSKLTIIVISSYLLYALFGMAVADRQNKKAKLLKESGHYKEALRIMPNLRPYLMQNSDYWQNYGQLYFGTQNFQEALTCFKKAQTCSSLPEIYLATGKSYTKLKQYPKAIQEYETLVALYPSKFSYRMMLLGMYFKNKDVSKALVLAQEIIKQKPKIPSEKVNLYKKICERLLQKYAPHNHAKNNIKFKSFNFK